MLTTKLEAVWDRATQNQRVEAIAWANVLRQNLIHYHDGRYTPDDVHRIAAELLAKLQENE